MSWRGEELPALSASASKDKNGIVHISVVNIDPAKEVKLLIDLRGGEYSESRQDPYRPGAEHSQYV